MPECIHVEKRYIRIPVSARAGKIQVTLTDAATGALVRYFTLPLDPEQPDFLAGCDLRPWQGHTLVLAADPPEAAARVRAALLQSELGPETDLPSPEPHRPLYHFSSRHGWLNDPNGLFYYHGLYHLFYQHNPFSIGWGNMHWGHAVSADLCHWRELGDVLFPDEHGTMFSGSAVVDYDNTSGLQQGDHPPVLLFYTAAGTCAPVPRGFTQCLAWSTDGGGTFHKYDRNPVIGELDPESRDPKVVRDEASGQWLMVLYLGDRRRAFALFVSADLLHWQRLQEFAIPEGRECPDFFPLPVDGEPGAIRWIFLEANGRYLIGGFDGNRFEAETGPGSFFASGGSDGPYAGQTWCGGPDGKRRFIAWQTGECHAREFNQSMTVPLELTLRRGEEGLRLCAVPAAELAALRRQVWELSNVGPDVDDCRHQLEQIPPGNAWDIELDMAPDCCLFVKLCGIPVGLDAVRREVLIAATRLELPPGPDGLRLRLLIDRASIEIFAGDGWSWCAKRALTEVVPPLVFARPTPGSGRIARLRVFEMEPATTTAL